jgi:hypothetical protein
LVLVDLIWPHIGVNHACKTGTMLQIAVLPHLARMCDSASGGTLGHSKNCGTARTLLDGPFHAGSARTSYTGPCPRPGTTGSHHLLLQLDWSWMSFLSCEQQLFPLQNHDSGNHWQTRRALGFKNSATGIVMLNCWRNIWDRTATLFAWSNGLLTLL